MSSTIDIFDKTIVRKHRKRATKWPSEKDYLHNAAAELLVERLEEIQAPFPIIAEIGVRNSALTHYLEKRSGTEKVIKTDTTLHCLQQSTDTTTCIVMDEEWVAMKEQSADMIVSNIILHWANDIPGTLVQLRQCLKPGGVCMVSLLGGATLQELRQAIAEQGAEEGRMAARVSPVIDIKDAGMLMQRAGFAMPVADSDHIEVQYASAAQLMQDLHRLGESNALKKRPRSFMTRQGLEKINSKYHTLFSNGQGKIPATFEIITLTGWKLD